MYLPASVTHLAFCSPHAAAMTYCDTPTLRYPSLTRARTTRVLSGKQAIQRIGKARQDVQAIEHLAAAQGRHRLIGTRTPHVNLPVVRPHHPYQPHSSREVALGFGSHLWSELVG